MKHGLNTEGIFPCFIRVQSVAKELIATDWILSGFTAFLFKVALWIWLGYSTVAVRA
jgi:hypothetical protein